MPDIVSTFTAVDRMSGTLAGIGGKLDALGDKADMSTRRMAMAGGAMAGAGAVIAAGLGVAVASAIQFDEELRNIQSISKQSDAEIGALGETMLDMAASGKSAGQSAQTMVKAMYDIYSSGFQGASALDLLENSARAASAGLTNTETSTRVLAATLNAYGPSAYSAREASDILFQTVNLGVVRFEELASVMGQVMPTAAATGVSLEELGAGMSVLTRRGLDAAESATALNQILMAYLKPSKAATELANQLGIEFNLSALQGKGLVASLQEIYTATGGDAAQLAIFYDNVRSARGAMSLMQDGGVMLTEMLEGMGIATEGAGATAEALEEQEKSTAHQLKLLKAQVGALAIGLGQELLPAVNDILGGGSKLLSMFMSLPAPVRDFTAKGLALSSMLLVFGGGMLVLIGYLPRISMGLQTMGMSAASANASVRGLAGGVTLLGTAVLLGIEVLMGVTSAMDRSDEKAKGMAAGTQEAATMLQALEAAGATTQEKVAALGSKMEETQAQIAGWRAGTEGAAESVEGLWEEVDNAAINMPILGALGKAIGGDISTAGEKIAEAQGKIQSFGAEITRLAGGPVQALNMMAQAHLDYQSVVVPALGEALKAYEDSSGRSINWAQLYESAMGGMSLSLDLATGQIVSDMGEIKGATDEDLKAAEDNFKSLTEAIKGILPTVDEEFTAWTARLQKMADDSRSFEGNMASIYEQLKTAGVSNIGALLQALQEQGPEYTANFVKWMAHDPEAAIAALKDTLPALAGNAGAGMIERIMGLEPGTLAAAEKGLVAPIVKSLEGAAGEAGDETAAVGEAVSAEVAGFRAEIAAATTLGIGNPLMQGLDPAAYAQRAAALGVSIIEGIRLGVTSMAGMLVSQVRVTIDTALAQMEDVAETGSPSERTRRLAQALMQGLMLGLQDESAAWKGTAAQTASEWVYVFGQGWVEQARELAPAVEASFASLTEAMEAGAAPGAQALLDMFVELAGSIESELVPAIEREKGIVDDLTWDLDVLKQNHEAVAGSIDQIKEAIDRAQSSLDYFASAPLVGTQKFADAAFSLNQQMNGLQLSINKIELGMLQEGLEEGEYASLKLSSAVRALAKDFDVELHSGKLSLEDINEVLDAAGIGMDELRLRAQNVDLQESLALDPLQQQIDRLLNSQDELTFEEIVAGIRAAQGELTTLNPLLDAANALYEQQAVDIENLEKDLATHTQLLADLQSALDGLPASLVDVATSLDRDFGQALADVFATRGDKSAVAKAEALFTELSRVLDEGGRGELIPALQTQMDSAMGVWSAGWQEFPAAVSTAMAGVPDAITTGVAGVPDALAAAAPDAAAAGAAYADAVMQTLTDKVNDFNMWVQLSGSEMAAGIAELIGQAGHALATGNWEEVYAAQSVFASFIDWLERNGEPGVADALRDISVLFSAAAQNMQSETEKGFVDLSTTGGTGAAAFMQAVIDVLEESGQSDLIPALQAAMAEGGVAAQDEAAIGGEATGAALLAGAADAAATDMPGTAADIGATMAEGLAKLSADAPTWGQAIAAYVMSGIFQGFFTDWDAWAERIADIIYQGLQDALEAHSPARKMIPLGAAMAAGVALGFERSAQLALPEAIAAPTFRVGALLPPVPAGAAPRAEPTPARSTKVITLQANITVHVPPGTMDPAVVGDVAYAAATRALKDMVAEMEAMEPTLGD